MKNIIKEIVEDIIKKDESRIFIYGPYACGKSSLAEIIGKEKNIPILHLDDLRYNEDYSLKLDYAEKIAKVNTFLNRSEWIIEGSWGSYAEDIAKKSDYMIFINQAEITTYFRIVLRQLKRINSNHIDGGLINCLLQLKYTKEYFRSNSGLSRAFYTGWLAKYPDKIHSLRQLF